MSAISTWNWIAQGRSVASAAQRIEVPTYVSTAMSMVKEGRTLVALLTLFGLQSLVVPNVGTSSPSRARLWSPLCGTRSIIEYHHTTIRHCSVVQLYGNGRQCALQGALSIGSKEFLKRALNDKSYFVTWLCHEV